MKKHLFRIIAVLSAAVLLAGCAASRLRLGAAAAGGVYKAFGTAMSAQNSTIEVKQTAGSAANLRLLAGGYLQLAVAQSDMAQDAYDGSGVFAHESTERSFSAVAALYEEAVQVVVRADSGITTLEELQGCTLSVGEEESGTEQNAGQVLAACGLNNRLVHTVNLNYTDAAARLADGTIDAMFVTAGLHADALEQLAKTCAIRLLSVDGGVGARLLAAYPAYRACVIPAGTYAGQGEDVWTVSVQALLLASNALSDETVQRLTARPCVHLFSQRDAAKRAHIECAPTVQHGCTFFCNHSISISVCFGSSFLASALGRCRVRMPFSNLALMSLGSSSLPT